MFPTLLCLGLAILGDAAENKTQAGVFTVEHPTLINLGFEWSIRGDANRNATVAVQANKQLAASGTFSDGTTMDVTAYVTWYSGSTATANVSNAYPKQGEAKGLAVGSTTITAVRGTVSATAQLQVQ